VTSVGTPTVPGAPAPRLPGTTAPPAPGRLGSPLDPGSASVYVDALGRWRDDRRRELEQLDKLALTSPDGASLTADIGLAMAVWKAVSDRFDLLLATWDGGRVGVAERERMSSLIWGRLDATLDPRVLAASSAPGSISASGLTVSLPEACRLSDALVSQLRVRLAIDPSGLEVAERLRQLRAQLERIRDQVSLEPAGAGHTEAAAERARLARRLQEVTERAGRGGDVGGMLEPLEIAASTFERDLIVNGALRRQSSAQVEQARALRADLELREGALALLVERCVAAVDPSPNYAVPDIDALGPVPNTPTQLAAYVKRLHQVSRAMTLAQDAYTAALSALDELRSRWQAYQAKAQVLGLADDEDVALVAQLAERTFAREPVRLAVARQVVELHATLISAGSRSGGKR
jgi:hypothetical protein